MNHRSTCPECKSERLESAGAPISAAGKLWYPRRCQKCGYFWSATEPLTLPLPTPHAAPVPVTGVPGATAVAGVPPAAAPAAPAKANGKGKGKGKKAQQQP
jgi:hypothetical protein